MGVVFNFIILGGLKFYIAGVYVISNRTHCDLSSGCYFKAVGTVETGKERHLGLAIWDGTIRSWPNSMLASWILMNRGIIGMLCRVGEKSNWSRMRIIKIECRRGSIRKKG